jgi:hypothetical protein
MLLTLSGWLYRISSGQVTVLGIVVFLAFTAIVLPPQTVEARRYAGQAGSPDTAFFYTPEDLYRIAEAYKEAGRAAYVRARFTFDLFWPLVYAFFLATSISWVYSRIATPGSHWRVLNLVPVIGMFFDYLENVTASIVMWRYPAATPFVDWLAALASLSKWFFIGASFLILLAGIISGAGRWFRKRVSSPT